MALVDHFNVGGVDGDGFQADHYFGGGEDGGFWSGGGEEGTAEGGDEVLGVGVLRGHVGGRC